MGLAREFQKLGYKVGVFTVPATPDGHPDPRWKSCSDFVTTKRERFLEVFKSSKKVMWFIDECNRTVGWHDVEMEATATSGSLYGHTCHYIAQRCATFNRNVREQCTRLYMFRQGIKDCRELYDQWGHAEIMEGPGFRKGCGIFCTTEIGSVKRIDLKLR